MEIAFEKEEQTRPKTKLWIILISVLFIFIISFIIFKIVNRNSTISEFKETSIREGIYKELMYGINKSLGGPNNIYEIYTLNSKVNELTDPAQARVLVQEQKEIVLGNINKLESTGEKIIYENGESYKCSDGKTYNYHPQSNICRHIGDGTSNLIRSKEKRHFQ